jgi:hypothetical protein
LADPLRNSGFSTFSAKSDFTRKWNLIFCDSISKSNSFRQLGSYRQWWPMQNLAPSVMIKCHRIETRGTRLVYKKSPKMWPNNFFSQNLCTTFTVEKCCQTIWGIYICVRNGAVLRELIYFTNKEVTNTRIAEAILKSYGHQIYIHEVWRGFTPCRTQNVSKLHQKMRQNDLE